MRNLEHGGDAQANGPSEDLSIYDLDECAVNEAIADYREGRWICLDERTP